MNLPGLWTTNQELTLDPFRAIRREMESAVRAFNQNSSSPDIGAGAPAINVAETKDAFEVTAELPGVDEKDIKVSLDNNQLVIWDSAPGVNYQVLATTNLSQPFQPISDVIPGSGSSTYFYDPTPARQKYYEIVIIP